ncbi:MAG: DNA gyrase subunit A [Clostridia bacterium]|nr:DNA gyrase subunit A [Clostridia bacterium]
MAVKETINWPKDEETKIVPVEICDEVSSSFLDYSMSVIVSRALPDVRDGLKPVHRRILYTMYENGLTPDKAHRKCADTVGSVLGRYHPHGDASVYDAMVRMAQDFSLRYPMVDGHGNFGSIDGYPAAAYRYTESRLAKLAVHMLDDIDKETVKFAPNYDDRLKEPTVLPSRFPSLLVNGSSGIAVGMATNIPPHNLGEVIDGMCCLIDNPDAELSDLCEHIKGPDFPTAGIIMGMSGIRAAYATGRGKIVLRGKTEIEETSNGRFRIVITEIPYGVNKKMLVKSICDLANEKRVEGIDDVVDHSSKRDGGIRIVVSLKKDANPQVVLNKLFAYTQLQSSFGVINLALVNGEPKVLTLKEMLQHYIDHQCEIIENRTRYFLRKAQERLHILDALSTALDFIDEVIAILRNSKSVNDGKAALMERFEFDEIQATAIVQMRLGQLTGLERQKIDDEIDDLKVKIADYTDILSNHSRVLDIVKTEALNLRDKYADDRRTEITAVTGEVDIEDLIPEENSVITLTKMGYVKRISSDEYQIQNRGGRGKKGMTTREEDMVDNMFVCSSHDKVMFFSNFGRVYRLKAYEIPEGTRNSKGLNIINVLPLQPEEKITVMLKVTEADDQENYICMVTKQGVIKRSRLSVYDTNRKGGINAIELDEGDELRWAQITDGTKDILVATRNGLAIRFAETDARPLGRTARGVRAISLTEGDEVAGMVVVDDSRTLFTASETGYGRRSPFSDYRRQSRGGKGMTNYKTAKYGKVASVKTVGEDEDAILISSNGVIIRIYADSVSLFSRTAKGVRVMRADEGDFLYTMEITEHSEDAEMAEAPSAEDMADNAPEVETEENLTAEEALNAVLKNAEENPVE